jgi:hypothetical protein
MGEELAVKAVVLSPLFPEVLDHYPRFIIERNQILIIKMYLREILLYHSRSSFARVVL